MDIRPYKKEAGYSYCLGAFPTIEMLKNKGEHAIEVIVSPDLEDRKIIGDLCKSLDIPVRESGKLVDRLGDKENVYIIGVFEKFENRPNQNEPHIVLVNPGNMGNLGTIIRTAVGFGIRNVIIIRPGADLFNPKTVRASMGAVFRTGFAFYDSFEEYLKDYPEHHIYTFMLDADVSLPDMGRKEEPYSLVFGNESTGLPAEFHKYGTSIIIPQTKDVDSLNITIAAAVAMYEFNGSRV